MAKVATVTAAKKHVENGVEPQVDALAEYKANTLAYVGIDAEVMKLQTKYNAAKITADNLKDQIESLKLQKTELAAKLGIPTESPKATTTGSTGGKRAEKDAALRSAILSQMDGKGEMARGDFDFGSVSPQTFMNKVSLMVKEGELATNGKNKSAVRYKLA